MLTIIFCCCCSDSNWISELISFLITKTIHIFLFCKTKLGDCFLKYLFFITHNTFFLCFCFIYYIITFICTWISLGSSNNKSCSESPELKYLFQRPATQLHYFLDRLKKMKINISFFTRRTLLTNTRKEGRNFGGSTAWKAKHFSRSCYFFFTWREGLTHLYFLWTEVRKWK